MFRNLFSLLLLITIASPCLAQRGAQMNWSHPINRGLVGYWSFDEGDGTRASDASMYRNHGTLTNMDPSTAWAATRVGGFGSLSFNGSTNYVALGTSPSLRLTGDLTIGAWVFKNSSTSGHEEIINAYRGVNPNFEVTFLLSIRGSSDSGKQNFAHFFHRNSSLNTNQIYSATAITVGQWQHVAVSINGSTLTHYLNGQANGTGTLTNARTVVGTAGVYVGSLQPDGVEFWNGRMDDVRVYNRALSASEVRSLYLLDQQQYSDLKLRGKPPAIVSIAAAPAAPFKPRAIFISDEDLPTPGVAAGWLTTPDLPFTLAP